MKFPLVSIIVTTKNEEAVIKTLLLSIKKQIYPLKEVILVDNKSFDKTVKIAKKYGVKCFEYGPERSAQRNYGASRAKGKYLLFLDADMELSPDVIKKCVIVCQSGENIAGAIIPEKSIARNFWEKVKTFERSIYNLEGDSTTDAARFFRKDIFLKTGGYDEKITGPEDWDLPETIQKKGYKITRVSAVIMHYERINSLLSLMRKKYYYGLKVNSYLKKQKIPVLGPKTIYFLRPVLYKNWKQLISHPFLTLAMFFMMFMELLSGGLGFIIGYLTNARRT